MEICDAWGNPLVYIPSDQYLPTFDSGQPYINANFDEWEAKPYKRDDGSFYNPNSYQLYSVGKDGEPNTEDDIKLWEGN